MLRSAIGRAILQIIACIPSPVSPATCAGAAAAMTLATGGSVVDAIKSAAFTFVQMGVWSGVGQFVQSVGIASNVIAKGLVHGVVGGALSVAQGGGFVQGFAANAVGAAAGLVSQDGFGPVGSPDGFLQRTAVAAIGGGLAAEITGGKFANGAVTAAFAHMLNAEAGRMFGAVGGGYGGAALGGSLTTVCAFFTGGGCATAGPYIVTGGAMIGRAIGGALGSAVEDWVFSDGDAEGVIYETEDTESGKPYVGRSGDWDNRQNYDGDGRDRRNARIIDTYPANDIDAGRAAEQRAINDRGGVGNLDNKRNEIAPRKWPGFGL